MAKNKPITKKNYLEQDINAQKELQKNIFDDNKKLSKFLGLRTKKDEQNWLHDNANNFNLNKVGVNMGLKDDPLLGDDNNSTNSKINNKGVRNMSGEVDEAIRKNKESEAIFNTTKTVDDMNNVMKILRGKMDDIDRKIIDSDKKILTANKLMVGKFDNMENKVDKVCEDNECNKDELKKLTDVITSVDKKVCEGNECNALEFKKINSTVDNINKVTCEGNECNTMEFKKINSTVDNINKVTCEGNECNVNKFINADNKLNTVINSVTKLEEEATKRKCPKCGEKTLIELETDFCPECNTAIKWKNEFDEENDDDEDNEYD